MNADDTPIERQLMKGSPYESAPDLKNQSMTNTQTKFVPDDKLLQAVSSAQSQFARIKAELEKEKQSAIEFESNEELQAYVTAQMKAAQFAKSGKLTIAKNLGESRTQYRARCRKIQKAFDKKFKR